MTENADGAVPLQRPVRRKLKKGVVDTLNETRKDPSWLTWDEIIALGIHAGVVYQAEDGIYQSIRDEREFSQYLVRFAQEIEARVRSKTGTAKAVA